MAIFTHTDCDGDSIELLAEDLVEDLVMLYANRNGSRSGGIRIPAPDARRLYDALGLWLQGGKPVAVPSADAIRTMVAEEFERLFAERAQVPVPLSMSPQAQRCEGTSCCQPHPLDTDPDPHDVGHCDPADDTDPEGCTCGHWTGWHGDRGCLKPGGCTCTATGGPVATPNGRLMEEIIPVKVINVDCDCAVNGQLRSACWRCKHPRHAGDECTGRVHPSTP